MSKHVPSSLWRLRGGLGEVHCESEAWRLSERIYFRPHLWERFSPDREYANWPFKELCVNWWTNRDTRQRVADVRDRLLERGWREPDQDEQLETVTLIRGWDSPALVRWVLDLDWGQLTACIHGAASPADAIARMHLWSFGRHTRCDVLSEPPRWRVTVYRDDIPIVSDVFPSFDRAMHQAEAYRVGLVREHTIDVISQKR